MKREKLTYRKWSELSHNEAKAASKLLRQGQNATECKYGFDSKGEIQSIMDYGALKNIFSI